MKSSILARSVKFPVLLAAAACLSISIAHASATQPNCLASGTSCTSITDKNTCNTSSQLGQSDGSNPTTYYVCYWNQIIKPNATSKYHCNVANDSASTACSKQ